MFVLVASVFEHVVDVVVVVVVFVRFGVFRCCFALCFMHALRFSKFQNFKCFMCSCFFSNKH